MTVQVISNAQNALALGSDQLNKKEKAVIGVLNNHKVATVVILSAASALALAAAIVAAVFSAFIVAATLATGSVVVFTGTIVATKIDLSKNLIDLIEKLSNKVKQQFNQIQNQTTTVKKESPDPLEIPLQKPVLVQKSPDELGLERLKKELQELKNQDNQSKNKEQELEKQYAEKRQEFDKALLEKELIQQNLQKAIQELENQKVQTKTSSLESTKKEEQIGSLQFRIESLCKQLETAEHDQNQINGKIKEQETLVEAEKQQTQKLLEEAKAQHERAINEKQQEIEELQKKLEDEQNGLMPLDGTPLDGTPPGGMPPDGTPPDGTTLEDEPPQVSSSSEEKINLKKLLRELEEKNILIRELQVDLETANRKIEELKLKIQELEALLLIEKYKVKELERNPPSPQQTQSVRIIDNTDHEAINKLLEELADQKTKIEGEENLKRQLRQKIAANNKLQTDLAAVQENYASLVTSNTKLKKDNDKFKTTKAKLKASHQKMTSFSTQWQEFVNEKLKPLKTKCLEGIKNPEADSELHLNIFSDGIKGQINDLIKCHLEVDEV